MSRHAPSASIETLRGVGPALRDKFAKLRIHTLLDLLLNLPHRYQDRTQVVPLIGLRANVEALVIGQVMESRVVFGNRRSWLVTIGDDTGFLRLRFFHFSERQRAGRFSRHVPALLRRSARGLQRIRDGASRVQGVSHQARRTGTETDTGLSDHRRFDADRASPVSSIRRWLRWISGCRRTSTNGSSRDESSDLRSALRLLHNPPTGIPAASLREARNRVVLDELISNIIVLKRRQRERATEHTLALPRSQQLGRVLLKRLGFELTSAQRRVTTEVLLDLEQSTPMLRLIQGDVGSGKTVIAAFAAVRAAEHGCQTAIMAPTEILAEQHYLNFSSWLEPLGVSVRLLTGRMTAAERTRERKSIASGDALVVVGTHALFQKDVEFAKLALVIIDEQHRFGVHQRMALRSKGVLPHQLIMTATPIPRTLTMALYADMNVSVIDEMPPGRQPIDTVAVVSDARRPEIVARIAQGVRERPAGLLGVHADRRVGRARLSRRRVHGNGTRRRATFVAGRAVAWSSLRARQSGGHGSIQSRRDRSAGGDHRSRSRRRRAERNVDGDREPGTARARATAPVARSSRARTRAQPLRAAVQGAARRTEPRAIESDARDATTASGSPRKI